VLIEGRAGVGAADRALRRLVVSVLVVVVVFVEHLSVPPLQRMAGRVAVAAGLAGRARAAAVEHPTRWCHTTVAHRGVARSGRVKDVPTGSAADVALRCLVLRVDPHSAASAAGSGPLGGRVPMNLHDLRVESR